MEELAGLICNSVSVLQHTNCSNRIVLLQSKTTNNQRTEDAGHKTGLNDFSVDS